MSPEKQIGFGHRALRRSELRAIAHPVRAASSGPGARVRAAILPAVQQQHTGERAERSLRLLFHVRPVGQRGAWPRQMLEPRPVGGSPPCQEPLGVVVLLRDVGGVVVFDLVIVPGQEPRTGGVRLPEHGVALVQRVPGAIVVERVTLRCAVLAYPPLAPRQLVDVVADVQHQIGLVGDDCPIGGVVAVLVLLAGGDGQSELCGRDVSGGRGGRAADRAACLADGEAVPVRAPGHEPAGFDVHAVRPVGRCVLDTGPDDVAKPVIGRDFPFHGHHLRVHPPAGCGRFGGKTRP